MYKSKQLYNSNNFDLPDIGVITVEPFPKKQIQIIQDQQKNESLRKIFHDDSNEEAQTYKYRYVEGFQSICGKENLYPIYLEFNKSKMILCSKDSLILADYSISLPQIKQKEENQQKDFILLPKYEKQTLSQVPTAIRAGDLSIYLGLQSGKIMQYNMKTKAFQGLSDDFEFPIMQIQILQERQNKDSRVIAIDSAGNIKIIAFSHKTFMDKIIKTLTSCKEVSLIFKNKKRQKLKKMFKGLMSNKQKDIADNETNSSSQNFGLGIEGFPYFYSRFNILIKQNQNEKVIMMAVFRKNILSVLVMNKDFQIKKQIILDEEYKNHKQIELAMLEFGEGGFQKSNNTHLILAYAIENKVIYFRTIEMQDNFEFVKISEIQNEQKIYYAKFISNNLLIFLNQKSISVSNVNQKAVKIKQYDMGKFSYIDFFVEQEKLEFQKKLVFRHVMNCFDKQLSQTQDHIFCYLEGKRMVSGYILSWESFINSYIQQQDWEGALNFSLKIYEGNLKKCGNINQNVYKRNEQMKSFFQKISLNYCVLKITEASMEQNPNLKIRSIINNVIYFLLKTDCCECLFSTIFPFLKNKELVELFLQQIQQYIQQSNSYNLKIPYVSQGILDLLIAHYESKNKQGLLERLIMNFDLSVMQKLLLLTTCLKHQLYQSLIFICCEQKDYITPVVKLCGIKLNNQLKIGQGIKIVQHNNKITEVIYWYLKECLLGHMTEYGNDAAYLNMLSILINFVFIPSSLEMLLQTSPKYLMQIINMFFQPKILKYILENEGNFFMRKNDYIDEAIFENNCLTEFKIYEKMLATLIYVVQNIKGGEKQIYQFQMYKLLTYIMLKNQFPFLVKYKIDIILFYLAHPFLFDSLGGQIDEDQQILINGHLMRLMDSMIRSINQKEIAIRDKMISSGLQNLQEILSSISKEKLKVLQDILQKIMISPFNFKYSELKCYIYHEVNRYGDVFQLYLRMVNKKIRIKIFSYLDKNLNEYEQLTLQFIKYIISLINLDDSKTISLISKLKDQYVNHEEIITKLVDYPNIQLSYIERLIQKKYSSKKLLLTHLQIVIREKFQELQNYIQRIDYPLQEAYKLCEQSNNKIGKAYILIKSGRNMEGVMMLTEIFLEYFQEYVKHIAKKIEYDPEKKSKMMKQFQVVLQTCSKEYITDNDRGQQIWEKNTETIFKKLNINNIENPNIPPPIREVLTEIVNNILQTMFQQVSTDFFLYKFSKTFGNLPFRVFIQAYKYNHNRLDFKFTLQKLNKDLLQIDQLKTWKILMKLAHKGNTCSLECSLCHSSVGINQKMISYSCNHVFHQQCYLEHNNKKSKNQLCPLCFNNVDSYLICGDKKLERTKVDYDENGQYREKINKLKYYDRYSNLSLVDSWSKFDQWGDL